ncbi:chloride channel protein [Pollutimonas nitritireducens]|uniref:Chloride channel protein n=1 Tax=Pollutimonas nitritireducens TaxID=2045209 RepID=A0A2N4UDK0_9BURK|nr:ClcB-like voltage-gated chloride channel protein [Pollutimonas nitritireducens]PLC53084.1 chloride channel protein [Pollutimonas nitritireducens]
MIGHPIKSMRKRLAGYSWLSDLPAMLCWAALTGVLGAFATILFHEGMRLIQNLVTGHSGSIVGVTQGLPWYGRLLFPAFGGLVAGSLLWLASRMGSGAHSDYMEAVALGDGRLSMRQGLLRSLSSLFTVASGGSIGREGAMVHMAALSASAIGRFTSFGTSRLRLLVACGAAAGVASAYGAPIAGALFVAEIVLGTMTMQSFGPLLVAAASANIVMRMTGHYETTYAMADIPEIPGMEVLPFVLLGGLAGLGAPMFLKFLDISRRWFKSTGLPLPMRLALGGTLLGLLLMVVPEVAGNGYSVVSSLLHTTWTWYAVVLILICKVVATALTVGSGAVGGVFTPALFVGGAIGTLFGQLMMLVWPGMTTEVYVYTLVGMGSFLGAATSAPLMAILMIFEMTLSYQLVLPLMLACVVAFFVARAVAEVAMYDVTVVRERDVLLRQQLRNTMLDELLRPATTVVVTTSPVSAALQMFLDYPVRYLYVVDEENSFQGVVAQQDLTSLLLERSDINAKLAGEVLRRDFVKTLHPGMTLDEAQDIFVQFPGERLPVVSRGEKPTLLGVVYKSSVLEKYSAIKRSLDAGGEAMLAFGPLRQPRK